LLVVAVELHLISVEVAELGVSELLRIRLFMLEIQIMR
jgi:hypothetical protein